jgi:glyoxylase-like metal-dependent hydrolase (beta-lactamase superfamily II)
VEFPFDPLEDGELIDVGNTKILVLHTPGHTPEGVCLLVSDHRRGPEPWFLLTGDTLFVGAVGRPDIPGNERDNAGQLYDSLHTKILPLPDEIEIYPAHFLGSACGSGMSGKPTSTLGFERRLDPLLSLDREAFVAAMAADIPPKPADMASVLAFNCGREAARA